MERIVTRRFLPTTFFCIAFLLISLVSVVAQTPMTAADGEKLLKDFSPSVPSITTPRNHALGGYHAAYRYNGAESVFSNPASLSYINDTRWTFASLGMNFSGPFFDIMSELTNGDNDVVGKIAKLITDSGIRNMKLDIPGPIAISFSGRNLAFGLYNNTTMEINIPSITQTSFFGAESMMITSGYGTTVFDADKHTVSAGVSLRGYMQTAIYKRATLSDMADYLNDFDIDNAPSLFVSGFGFTLGALYNYNNMIFAGITWRDPFNFITASVYENFDSMFSSGTSVSSTTYRRSSDLSVGVCWEPEFKVLERYVTRFDIMLDYHNVLSLIPGYDLISHNPILDLSFGTELVIHDVLSLRLGINECYLSAGLGLDLTWFVIDFAAYGQELGVQPGQKPCYNLAFSLSFTY